MKPERRGAAEVGWAALKLGLTSFGGPIAHIGYFREEYVQRRKWLDEPAFADLAALCQFLPGPASSQLGIAIGMRRAGLLGGLAAWAGFTLPSALLLVAAAWLIRRGGGFADAGWLHGLKLVAVAVVAQAVWSMARTLAADRVRASLAAFAAAGSLLAPGTAGQLVPLALCGLFGLRWLRPESSGAESEAAHPPLRLSASACALALFAALLVALPLWTALHPSPAARLIDGAYRAGSLVFGGGHVVLPMLRRDVVGPGLLSDAQFVAGYGMTQAVPGPLFTFAAYIGAASASGRTSLARAAAMLIAIFLPSFLLVVGTLPLWTRLRANRHARGALAGVNAGVVGLLAAALYDPVWTGTVAGSADFAAALALFVLLTAWKCPPWALVLLGAGIGAAAF
jgi:chromate transporter